MTMLGTLPALAVITPQGSTTNAIQGADAPDMFDNLWIKLADLTGNPTTAPASSPIATATTAAPTTTAAPSSTTAAPSSGGGLLSNLAKLEQWAADLVTRQPDPQSSGGAGLSLEDLVFITLGVLLIAAAAFSFVFTLKETQNVVKGATKAARGAVDAKLAPVVAAAVA
jgi:hypothetical protein